MFIYEFDYCTTIYMTYANLGTFVLNKKSFYSFLILYYHTFFIFVPSCLIHFFSINTIYARREFLPFTPVLLEGRESTENYTYDTGDAKIVIFCMICAKVKTKFCSMIKYLNFFT